MEKPVLVENENDCTKLDDNLSVGEKIQELSNRLQNVTAELHNQVADKHDALLQQATHAGRFDNALNNLSEDVERIRSSAQKLRAQVDTQYQQVYNQTRVLSRMHEVTHLLRSSGTLLTLSTKLKGTKDVLKQAEIHYELSQFVDDEDLKGVEFIQAERTFVIQSRQKIRNLTQMQLVTGLVERNEGQVSYALKVFQNLNALDKSLENLVKTILSDLEQGIKECFAGTDISVLNKLNVPLSKANNSSSNNVGNVSKSNSQSRGPGKTPQLTTTQNFRAKFWKSLHWLIYDEIYEGCEQIKLLRRSLESINQFEYVNTNSEKATHKLFWQKIQGLLRKSFTECPLHITQTLQEGLSKLLSSVRGLEARLNGEFLFDNNIFTPLQVGYVSKCGANLKATLAGIDMPSNETVDNFIRIASTELSAALIDASLAHQISAVFMACGKELCTKLESQIKLGVDAKQVVDIPNIQQLQNTVLANVLFYYKDSVKRMLADLSEHLGKSPSTVKQDILASLDQADLLVSTILQQLMDSILSTCSIIILSMHREPGLNAEKIPTSGPSMFIKELQEFITRSWVNHLMPFDDKGIVEKCGHELAKRCIELFIHNLSVLRPLSTAGRQRMQNDCAHLETALKPICDNLLNLGKPARLLRAISFLIVQSPEELIKQNVIGKDALVPSYIILFLLFGHASNELQSPHTTVNWSNERLIEWLDGHTSEREKLELISGALQRYREHVRRKKSEKYDEVFPIMVEFFEKAIKIDEN